MRDVLAKEIAITGTLQIHRAHSTREPDYVTLRLTDRLSRCDVVEIKMSIPEFAEALLGMGDRECSAILRPAHAGQRLENETQAVTWYNGAGEDAEVASREAAIARLEVGGWIGNRSDAKNHHRLSYDRTGKTVTARVNFQRWVDVEPEAK